MPDHLIRALLVAKDVRIVATLTTETVATAARRHGLMEGATVALGRALTSGLLLATLTKGEERVALQIAGDGPISLINVDASGEGDVRGYISPPGVPAPLGPQRRPQVGAAIGRGQVTVVRDLGLREQYRGSAAIVTGEIDEDVEAYLRQSEQLDSALGCEVVLGATGEVQCAGGILVQAMPGGEPELIRKIQHELRTTRLYQKMAENPPPAQAIDLANAVLADAQIQVLDERAVEFRCRCSPERVHAMVDLLNLGEIDELLADPGRAEIQCNFCGQRFIVERDALAQIRDEKARRPPRAPN